jgi:hypothetical protein
MTEGRPPAVVGSASDVRVVTTSCQDDSTRISDLSIWKIGLAQIQNRLCWILSNHETLDERRAALQGVEQWLTRWREGVAVECRPGQDLIPGSEAYSLTASLHLEYFSLARAFYWSLIHSPHMKDHHNGDLMSAVPRNCHKEYVLCLGSARAFVRTLNRSIHLFSYQHHFLITF